MTLPFLPFPSLEIEGLCTVGPLILDVVGWDMLGQRFNLFCLPITSKRKMNTVLRRFAGDWEWCPVECECDDDDGDSGPTQDGGPDDPIRKILGDRSKGLPANPRDAEQN